MVTDGKKSSRNREVEVRSRVRGGEGEPAEQPTWRTRLRDLNLTYPWLKVVLVLILVSAIGVGAWLMVRQNAVRTATTGAPVGVVSPNSLTEEPAINMLLGNEMNQGKTDAPDEKASESEDKKDAEAAAKPETESETKSEPKPEDQTGNEAVAPVGTGPKMVALTFDDGPSATETPRLLKILAEKQVPATFFVVGTMAQKSPGILKDEKTSGHEVGSHTMTHANLKKTSVDNMKWEFNTMNDLFVEVLGEAPRLMRPPYGNINDAVRANAKLPLVLWTVDPEDWKVRDAATVRQRAVGAAFDGAIILFHDVYASTIDAIPGVIDDLRAQGYAFYTVSGLAQARGVTLQNGVAYGSFRP